MSDQKREPVKYTVLERSLIDNRIYEAGEEVMYDGLPAENLAPTDDEGRARYQEYLASNKERVQKMNEAFGASQSGIAGDPAAFAAAVAKAVAEANAEAEQRQAELLAKVSEAQTAAIADAVAAALARVFPNGTTKKAVDPAVSDKPAEGGPIA